MCHPVPMCGPLFSGEINGGLARCWRTAAEKSAVCGSRLWLLRPQRRSVAPARCCSPAFFRFALGSCGSRRPFVSDELGFSSVVYFQIAVPSVGRARCRDLRQPLNRLLCSFAELVFHQPLETPRLRSSWPLGADRRCILDNVSCNDWTQWLSD